MSSSATLPPLMVKVRDLLSRKKKAMAPQEIAEELMISGKTVRQTLYVMNKIGIREHVGKERSAKGEHRAKWKIAE